MSTTAFGDFLRFYRLRVPLTQEQLSERTGLSMRAISDMERGRTLTPQNRTVRLLVEGLGLAGDEAVEFAALARTGRVPDEEDRPAAVPAGTACALPPVLVELTGREGEQLALSGFACDAESSSLLQITVIHGPPGAGKTALAVDAAHRLGRRFANGCVFLDLRGMDDEPLSPDRAAHRLLRGFNVDERQIPAEPDDRLSLYHSLLRDRTVLLVLDNAANEAQVRPLLASSPGTMVLVTSRNTLAGLDARHRLALDLLPLDRSVDLLRAIAGRRVETEPKAAHRVAELCGGMPLALLIAGNRLASRPQWTIAHLADQLEDERRRLSVLRAGDLQVRTAFELSYHHLNPAAATLFRRLALVPGPDTSVELAEVVTDGGAEEALEELVDASLLGISETSGRYTRHDLLRVFAVERLELDEDPAAVRELRVRLRQWLLAVATRAAQFFDHDHPAVRPLGPVHDRESAGRWLTREPWLAAVRSAVEVGEHERVLALAQAMHWYSDMHGVGELWREVFGAGADAARHLGNAKDTAEQLNYLAWSLYALCGQTREALVVHEQAVDAQPDDILTKAWTWYYGSAIHRRNSEPHEAVRQGRLAVALFEQAGYPIGENLALSLLGLMLHGIGALDEAVEVQRRSVAQHRASGGDDELLSMMLIRLATSLAASGEVTEALSLLDEAESLFRKHGTTAGVARVRHNRGLVLMDAGRLTEAKEHLRSALGEARLSDHRIEIMVRLAELADAAGESAQARELRVRALAECDRYDTSAVRRMAAKLAAGLGLG